MENKNTTIFLDLDGTLVEHNYTPLKKDDVVLPGVVEFLSDLKAKHCYCILTTARSLDECRKILLYFKQNIDFCFNEFLYNLPSGIRIVINDKKNSSNKAIAINVTRNSGLVGIKI